jgi:putative ABC transport system permease protein
VIAIEINLEGDEAHRVAALFSEEARRLPEIQQASVIESAYRSDPAYVQFRRGFGMGTWQTGTSLHGFEGSILFEAVDEHYLETLGIELLAGRNFSTDRPADLENGILVNQTFAETMGWDHPVGQVIVDKPEGGWRAPLDGKEVIGVISDYHLKPLFEPLQPIVLQHIHA